VEESLPYLLARQIEAIRLLPKPHLSIVSSVTRGPCSSPHSCLLRRSYRFDFHLHLIPDGFQPSLPLAHPHQAVSEDAVSGQGQQTGNWVPWRGHPTQLKLAVTRYCGSAYCLLRSIWRTRLPSCRRKRTCRSSRQTGQAIRREIQYPCWI